MEIESTVCLLFASSLLVLILVLLLQNKLFTHNRIPGPRALPFIGNLLDLHGQILHELFHNYSLKYGNIFRVYIGNQVVVVLSGNAIKNALVRKPTLFAGRPSYNEMGIKFNYEPSLVMADYGPKWRLYRRMGHAALKVYGKSQLQAIICAEVDDLCSRLEKLGGKPLAINEHIGMSLTNVICTQIFGSKYDINDSEFKRVYELNETITNTNVIRSVVDVIPCLRRFIDSDIDEDIRMSDRERFLLLTETMK